MSPIASSLLSGQGFIPHGYCLAWDPLLLWSTVTADLLIGLSYYSIPFAIFYFLRRQRSIRFNGLFWMFGLFILACGTTHFIHVINIWYPIYRLDAAALVVTAGISVATAVMLWPLVPEALAYLRNRDLAEREVKDVNVRLTQSVELLRQRSNQVEESEKRFRLAMENAPIGMAIVALDGHWLVVNQALCTMLGYSREELMVKTFQDITVAEDLAPDLEQVQKLLDGAISSYQMEKRYLRRNGSEIAVQLDVVLLRDSRDQPLHFISQIQDISVRRRLAEELGHGRSLMERGLAEMQRSNHEMAILSDLTGILQVCKRIEEVGPPLRRFGGELFAGCSGAVYLLHASRNYLEPVAEWGESLAREPVFAPDDCWALRLGQPHWADTHGGLRCAHLRELESDGSASRHGCLCTPLMAYGEVLGTLCLYQPAGQAPMTEDERKRHQKRVSMFADSISIAVANINLRQVLRTQSIRDPLTGLFNRRYLEESLPRDLAEALRTSSSLAVMMIDIDHFKKFNDSYGHDAGDHVLQQVCQQMAERFRGSDIACRYGGEEFAVVMPHSSLAQAQTRAEELRASIQKLILNYRGVTLPSVRVSIGLSCYPEHGNDAGSLIHAADQALYRAKRAGRNRVLNAEA